MNPVIIDDYCSDTESTFDNSLDGTLTTVTTQSVAETPTQTTIAPSPIIDTQHQNHPTPTSDVTEYQYRGNINDIEFQSDSISIISLTSTTDGTVSHYPVTTGNTNYTTSANTPAVENTNTFDTNVFNRFVLCARKIIDRILCCRK